MDRFNVADLDSACGYVSWLGDPKQQDDEGVLVERLRTLGAVILCKTNVPMSSMVRCTTTIATDQEAHVAPCSDGRN